MVGVTVGRDQTGFPIGFICRVNLLCCRQSCQRNSRWANAQTIRFRVAPCKRISERNASGNNPGRICTGRQSGWTALHGEFPQPVRFPGTPPEASGRMRQRAMYRIAKKCSRVPCTCSWILSVFTGFSCACDALFWNGFPAAKRPESPAWRAEAGRAKRWGVGGGRELRGGVFFGGWVVSVAGQFTGLFFVNNDCPWPGISERPLIRWSRQRRRPVVRAWGLPGDFRRITEIADHRNQGAGRCFSIVCVSVCVPVCVSV